MIVKCNSFYLPDLSNLEFSDSFFHLRMCQYREKCPQLLILSHAPSFSSHPSLWSIVWNLSLQIQTTSTPPMNTSPLVLGLKPRPTVELATLRKIMWIKNL